MMTRITLLCVAVALGVGSSAAAALPSVRPTAVTRDVAAATITGHVTDATGRPLANAQVSRGRHAAPRPHHGRRSLRASPPFRPERTPCARCSSASRPRSRSVTVADQPITLDFSLTAQTVQLEAVVTVWLRHQRRQDVTGAVSSVNVTDVPIAVTQNVGQMLEGRVAGAQVTQNNGAPGGGLSIRVRGANSIAANSEPLYVIDGIPAITGTSSNDPYQNPLSSINPSDIENIEVLKDASSTAIYGARGAAGVVLITTKRGQRGQNHVTIDASMGNQSPAKKIAMLNGLQFAQLANEGRANIGGLPFYTDSALAAIPNGGVGTNWQNLVLQNSLQQSYNIGATGGDDATRYLISGGYYDQGGIVIGSGFTRYSGRVNLERNVSKKFLAGTNLTLSRTANKIQSSDNSLGSSTAMGALWFNPADPVTRPDGTYLLNSTVTWPIENPVANTVGLDQKRTLFNAIGNGYAEYSFSDALKARTSVGITANFDRFTFFAPRTIPAVQLRRVARRTRRVRTTTSSTRTRSTGATSSRATRSTCSAASPCSGSAASRSTRATRASRTISSASTGSRSGTLPSSTARRYSESALLSYLGRATYNVKDRYLLTLTGRADGSSRFGENNKWGFFPSAAVAWRLIDESFMKNQNLFSDMKLRLSYGVTGNQEIGLYQSLATLSGNNYAFGGTNVIGYATVLGRAEPGPQVGDDAPDATSASTWAGSATASPRRSTRTGRSRRTCSSASTCRHSRASRRSCATSARCRTPDVELQVNSVNFAGERFGWRSSLSAAKNSNKVLALGVASQIPYTGDKGISGQTGGAVHGHQGRRAAEQLLRAPHERPVPAGRRVPADHASARRSTACPASTSTSTRTATERSTRTTASSSATASPTGTVGSPTSSLPVRST